MPALPLHRQSKGQDPRQARPLRPPREHPHAAALLRGTRSRRTRLVYPRSELVAAAGIGGGGLRLRYRGWLPLRLFFFRVASIGGES